MWEYGKLVEFMSEWEKVLTVSAAWVQAFGSIIALVVAFVIAGRQARRDNRRRKQEADDWRSSLIDLAITARLLVEQMATIKDPNSGAEFAQNYDRDFCHSIAALLYSRINSEKMSVRDLRSAMGVRSELVKATKITEDMLPFIRAEQFPWDALPYLEGHARVIAVWFDALAAIEA